MSSYAMGHKPETAAMRVEGAERQSAPIPTPDEVRAHLTSILDRTDFEVSDRNRRFLSYIVEETLEGRASRIKAYAIAVAAFNRGDDFDPLTDPIVRIEASRLRRSLEHYYLTAGQSDPVRITIPKGSYVPTFAYGERLRADEDVPTHPSSKVEVPSGIRLHAHRWPVAGVALALVLLITLAFGYQILWRGNASVPPAGARGPAILVMPFEDITGAPSRSYLARGLTYDVVANLTRFREIQVFGPDLTGADTSERASSVQYVLTGSVKSSDDRIWVTALLSDAQSGQYIWSWNTEHDLNTSNIAKMQVDIAGQVASTLAQPYGIVYARSAGEITRKPATSLTSYECVVRFKQYWRSYDANDFNDVRRCLEQGISNDPQYAPAYSSLALLYVDTYRFGFGREEVHFDPLQRAHELANQAVDLDPTTSDAYLALSMVNWFSNQVESSISAAETGLKYNPNNADLLGELGFRYALLGQWDKAMPLVSEAYARNPAAPTGYRIATFLHAYTQGDYETALEEAMVIEAPYILYGHVARAMAYAQLGETKEAAQAVAEIKQIDPQYGSRVVEDMTKRNVAPEIIRAIVDGLAKAGLKSG